MSGPWTERQYRIFPVYEEIMEDKLLIGIDLSAASPLLIDLLMEDAADPSIFEEIARANENRPEILRLLLENPAVPDETKQLISDVMSVPVKVKSEIVRVHKTPEERVQTIFQRIQKLSVSERIILALRGGKEIRTILFRDPNKSVSLGVLDNPKITDTEIEMIAKSPSIPEDALRKITKKRAWMKNYEIIRVLVTNPKIPVGIALSLLTSLKTRDLTLLEKNRNISEGVRGTAKKILKARRAH
jgi:hypothetical protein